MPDYCNHRLVSSITDKVFYNFIALQDFKLHRNMFFRFWYQNPLTTPPRDVIHVLYRLSRLYMLVPSMSCTSGEVVVNRFPQRRDRLAHKIIQDIAARNPPRTALATISSFHCPYPISHRTLRRPAALPCYTGPSYEGSRSEPANQPRSCDTPQPHFQTEDIILCSTRSILIIAYFYVNCVKVEENH